MDIRTAHVCLLDGFRVSVDDVPAAELPHCAQRLIAHLSLSGRPARGAVAGRLWPEVSESHAQGSLRSALWRVQRAVPGLVEVSGGALTLAEGVRVDAREFTHWARAVLAPEAPAGVVDPPAAALAGELLPGWYDDWVVLERERLRQLRMHALEVLADRLLLGGRYAEALQVADAAARHEPLRESAHRAVIRVCLAQGDPARAVRVYETFRDALARELGVAPTGRMEDLAARGRVPATAGDRGPGGVPRPRPAADPVPGGRDRRSDGAGERGPAGDGPVTTGA
ncbi:DNA-binding transcriptional activator of the SARP family [Geodermatophilus pulveris]|uniref:DNA-binding transcriptional activator of the SARP family n=1 Tax=Geodermatophilus pulveris TaxID=1564159 RepID=A0A239C5L6_9ACTN|nr:BTAD domain-containing putative transcriptional regulator [Geodermatophilus pulveris]SNS14714.1 DNA-binding transcriptional activator of the SARP family [Geodermatophilus pulveris]